MPRPHFIRICLFLSSTLLIFLFSCEPSHETYFQAANVTPISVSILPISYQNEIPTDSLSAWIRNYYGFECQVLPSQTMPEAFVNTTKSVRYSADSILRYLRPFRQGEDNYVVGITSKEIFCTKRNIDGTIKQPESKYRIWAIFGYGSLPGPTCIVSTKRLASTDSQKFQRRVRNVILHELGHNLGLPHCPTPNCVMNDANETIATVDQSSGKLCLACKEKVGLKE